jgi:glutamyl-Q tRNA(Asp) synthetase
LPRSSTATGTTADPLRLAGEPLRPPASSYRGRFAPSPTGPLHLGSLLAAAASWLDARAVGGDWLLRIEDLDPPREPPGAAEQIIRTLDAFGLWWDGEILFQSHRQPAYEEALRALLAADVAYHCGCSRADIEAANTALGRPGDRRYPGTCRTAGGRQRDRRVIRVRTTAETLLIQDRLQADFAQSLEADVGDFVVRRREGYTAYQLAVVVDDAAQGITDVVRGIDLLDSTPRQVFLQGLLGLPRSRYMHVPIVAGRGGEKLSKQTGAAPVEARNAGGIAWQILTLLRHPPPPELRGAAPSELWAWATACWRPQQLAEIRSIPAPRPL